MTQFTAAVAAVLWEEAFVPTAAYAKRWRERYDLAFKRSVEARKAGHRAEAARWLKAATWERVCGWETADDRRRRFMESAEKLEWDWSVVGGKT